MELTLANLISNFLVLGFKSLIRDTENFISSVHFFLQIFPRLFSMNWDSFWGKKQISSNCGPLDHKDSCKKDGKRSVQIAEINLMMNRLGKVVCLELDCGDHNSSLGEEDLLRLFDEEEPSFEEIKETFRVFDVNNDGFVDAIELQGVLCNLGLKEGCSLEECKKMIKSCDDNGDGLIDFQEFVKFMEKCLC